jgi:Transcription factor WhiB/Homeodomain-like domain
MQAQVAQDWRSRSACRDVDPELFFPVAEPGTEPYELQVAEAKQVCAECPVRALCLEFALAALPHGVAGGLTEGERRNLRARRARQRRSTAPAPVVDEPALDPVLVERLARHGRRKGEMSAGQRRELRQAVLVLAEAGVPVPAIAERLDVAVRTVERWLAQRRNGGGEAA